MLKVASKIATIAIVIISITSTSFAQPVEQGYSMLKWRIIGPYRGGRTVGASGNPTRPNEFYIGVNNGGVWKTTDYGRVWTPVFDSMPTGSIGDVAVAPTNPEVVYVGSGEGLQRPDLSVGNGMYKSVNGGKSWKFIGLSEPLQIGGLAVSPINENVVFVAALGHPYGANKERGIYRTTDGGETWKKVLYLDDNTGGIQVAFNPKNPEIIYADLYAGRLAPWENGMFLGEKNGLYVSADGGDTWQPLANGLPGAKDGLGRIGFCIAPSDPDILYACVDASTNGGFYGSTDGGRNWKLLNGDKRLWARGSDFAECKVDPKDPNKVYVANVVTWKSEDGGKSFNAFRGAPGGDDYHRLWINPQNPDVILLAGDQGAIITVNGGATWSSWYNQPTAQFYHVSTDNAFPYNVYGGQQESGSIGITSRGNDGAITFREWHSVGAEEYGYVAADPLNPDIIYGGKLSKFDKRTGQVQHISPAISGNGRFRFIRTAPVLFSPVDNKTLYYAGNVLFKTTDGGNKWDTISPDLTRETYDISECIGIFKDAKMSTMPRRGVIYAVAPSHFTLNTIWAGTDDGLVHITTDGGKKWTDITPQGLTSWSKISQIDASHFDDKTAYIAVNKIRLDDYKPYIFKTHDGGKTWKLIVTDLPDDPINTVREDPEVKGLLYAGSERMVYVSFDDGAHWQSLRMNMPCTSIRDLVVKDNDLVVGTHGRSFWILDNVTGLRQLARQNKIVRTTLYPLAKTYLVRWNMNTDTPLPQEEPAGENPPDGAILDYYLDDVENNEVTLEIKDADGNLVRKYSSNDTFYRLPMELNIPTYWVRPQIKLSNTRGAHRFIWDLRYTPLPDSSGFPISAIYQNTAPNPSSPKVIAGKYIVTLKTNGHSYTQPIEVTMDPRVKTSKKDLEEIHQLSIECYRSLKQLNDLKVLPSDEKTLNQIKGKFSQAMNLLEQTEMPVTVTTKELIAQARAMKKTMNN